MTASNTNNDNNQAQVQNQGHASSSHLHAAYTRLTFKSDPTSPQDSRREALFQRLVQHHLLQNHILTRADWLNNMPKQQECTYAFLTNYAKALWPGNKAGRSHLANPGLRSGRSFVGDMDGHWSGRDDNKSKAKVNEQVGCGGYDLDSPVGRRSLSKVGKAWRGYVDVLMLEVMLNCIGVEDSGALVAGILQC